MNMIKIPLTEIDFHPASFCDRDGRVFWWKGELYRGISEGYAGFCKMLFDDGFVRRLVQKNFLVETELTSLTLNGYPQVLKHRPVPFVSYAHEWCPEMLRDAGLFIADMALELATAGLTLDADTWDMLFDGTQPVYVDFTSIVAAGPNDARIWKLFRDDFHSYFIYPLQLIAQGYGNLARWLLADYQHDNLHSEFAALMGKNIYNYQAKRTNVNLRSKVLKIGSKLAKTLRKNFIPQKKIDSYEFVTKLRKELENIKLPSADTGRSSSEGRVPSLTPSDEWTLKHRFVHKVLSDLKPATVLDLGCGLGWYSRMAASLGSNVVAIDIDDRKIASCYKESKMKSLRILPVVMDIGFPSPGQGPCNTVILPALQRFQCDMVLALSLVHMLVLKQNLTFEQICQTFSVFSKKWLLIEFISREDPDIRENRTNKYFWYSYENFLNVLSKWFSKINVIQNISEFRVLLLCEK